MEKHPFLKSKAGIGRVLKGRRTQAFPVWPSRHQEGQKLAKVQGIALEKQNLSRFAETRRKET